MVNPETKLPARAIAVAALALFASCGMCAADLGLALELKHRSVLRFEPLMVTVTLRNEGAYAFAIDAEHPDPERRVDFLVERGRDELSGRVGDAPLVNRLVVPPGEGRRFSLDLGDAYDLRRVGHYVVRAVVTWDGVEYESNRVLVDVVEGMRIAQVKKGIWGYPGTERTYSLRYWRRERQEELFLRVDDEANNANMGVFALGKLIRVFDPIINVSRAGRVTVLHQSGPRKFTRSVFRALQDGMVFVQQTDHDEDGTAYGIGVDDAAADTDAADMEEEGAGKP